MALNQRVLGSSPSASTIFPYQNKHLQPHETAASGLPECLVRQS